MLYLVPTRQLVDQVVEKAREYGIPAVKYVGGPGYPLPEEFLSAQSTLVCTYKALFNGQSKFGVANSNNEIVSVAAIILDDAHAAVSEVRDAFTLRVEKKVDQEGYAYLCNLFRNDFFEVGRGGTFDDVVSGADYSILEVPYWAWQNRSTQVAEYLRPRQAQYRYVWPLLRDSFDYCHALISRDSFIITPILLLVDMLPTFSRCPRRVFMSATISDDSTLVRTFGADVESLRRPITSQSLAGVSERMILVPDLMGIKSDIPKVVRSLASWAAKKGQSTVVLVPSDRAAAQWTSVGTFADTPEKVSQCVTRLVQGEDHGPYIFANRYDGIDLPGPACRVLILDGLPKAVGEYDLFRSAVLSEGTAIDTTNAQRLEQGMGRGARGANDYCVVILTGSDIVAWLAKPRNRQLLTTSTRAQLQMGLEVSKQISSFEDFSNTVEMCFERNQDWVKYHAETLADLTEGSPAISPELDAAGVERKAFQLMRDGYYEKAIARLEKLISESQALDRATVGWLSQLAARAAYYWGKRDKSLELQQAAYAANRNLLRPQVMRPYVKLISPGKQSERIVEKVVDYLPRQGYLAEYNEVVSHLVPEASANQFEQALMDLGKMLGFAAERPDKTNGVGPDVLWVMRDDLALVIEAKSRKKFTNALNKEDAGQLLGAIEWFKEHYEGMNYVAVSVLPQAIRTPAAFVGDARALTYAKLNQLVADIRRLLEELCDSAVGEAELRLRCEQLLASSTLVPDRLVETYLEPFMVQ